MRVSAITSDGDWTFGRGKANYIDKSAAVRQNVVTRLRSFKNDYFANMNAGIDWIEIFGIKGNEARILREIESMVLQTTGVRSIDKLEIIARDSNRGVTISLKFTDLYDETYIDEVVIA